MERGRGRGFTFDSSLLKMDPVHAVTRRSASKESPRTEYLGAAILELYTLAAKLFFTLKSSCLVCLG